MYAPASHDEITGLVNCLDQQLTAGRASSSGLTAIAAADPDAEFVAPPAPRHGIHDARPARLRYVLVHQIEAAARHAGHADIIREQLDGETVPKPQLSVEGMPPSPFYQPCAPAPGTIGAP